MRNNEHSRPRKRLQMNDGSYHQNQSDDPYCRQKLPFILDQNVANQKLNQGKIYKHHIGNQTIYFPHNPLYEPQRKFIEEMFKCLDKKNNLLIQSPTGTGKTLNLLVSALQWAENYYQDSEGGVFDNQTKIIYTSRSHSQLDQISKQLEKTPYRPKMLIFGSREKLCINEELEKHLSLNEKDYENWKKKCSIAVGSQQLYLKNQTQIDREISQKKITIADLKSKPSLNKQQMEQLQAAQQFLNNLNMRCTHYQDYNKGFDASFHKHIGHKVLNNKILKKQAREFYQHSICPFYYPKRVKNRGTLYLMPYNYILDATILKYSTGFLQNSIIIFDQGHNILQTACEGYSVKLLPTMLQSALRNMNHKLIQIDFDGDQLQKEDLIKQAENQSEQDEDKQMADLLKEIENKYKQKKDEKNNQKKSEIISNEQMLRIVIKNSLKNFENFFKFERTDEEFKKINSKNGFQEKKSFYWQPVRQMFTYERQKMINWIEEILFSQIPSSLENKPLKEKLLFINSWLSQVIRTFMENDERFFKLMSLATFFERLYDVLYDKNYQDRFFLEINQLKKYQQSLRSDIFKGQIKLRCLAPDFAFKKLESINPRSIIITSGTLNPMKDFGVETGLSKLKYVQLDPVIKQKNVLVRKITKNLNGEELKIDSNFYWGKKGLEIENLTNLYNLLIKTIENIPHGVLVIVSSKSCLYGLQKFYDSSPQIKQKLRQVKQHVYFEPRKNLQNTMESYKKQSQSGKGALLFCVCRGKLSQGIDFKNRLCRSVIFLGIPYVSKGDPFVVSKGHYLKKMKYSFAQTWKFIEASKAINQGLGRVVRNSNDFGSILLFDVRYHNTNKDSIPVEANISAWIKKNWQVCEDPNVLQKQLSQFYPQFQQNFQNEDQQEY